MGCCLRRFDPCATSPWDWPRVSSRNRESLQFPSRFFVRLRSAFGRHARWLSIAHWGIPWESRATLRCRNESFWRRCSFLSYPLGNHSLWNIRSLPVLTRSPQIGMHTKIPRSEVVVKGRIQGLQVQQSFIHVKDDCGVHQEDLSAVRPAAERGCEGGRKSSNHFLSVKGDTPSQKATRKP
jgi:hypothetical protein